MKALRYFIRALRLRCPMCGISPIFVPWHRLNSLRNWFTPLDGCPRCGYAYERETGYFLLSIWAVNYGIGSLMGISIYLVLETYCQLPLKALLSSALIATASPLSISSAPKRTIPVFSAA